MSKTKDEIKKREKKLLELTDEFCTLKLDDDYKELCQKLILKLGRKRDVPFARGKIDIWAAAVIHAIGSINFLFDKSFEPFVDVTELNAHFGTKKSTVTNKSRTIRDLLKLSYFNTEFSTQHMNEESPLNTMVMVDGFIVPLSTLPIELQEMVKKARKEGRDIEFSTVDE